jgi:hypothetical protein
MSSISKIFPAFFQHFFERILARGKLVECSAIQVQQRIDFRTEARL